MALHSDEIYFPGPLAPLTDKQKDRIAKQEQERKALREAQEAAHLEAISAVDLTTARISAYVGTGGEISNWNIGGVYLSGNMSPVFRNWDGYDLVLQYCKDWAKATPKQFLKNCLEDSPRSAWTIKTYGVSKL